MARQVEDGEGGARDVVQPGLAAGLMADGFCLLVRLSMYDCTICQILLHTHTYTQLRDRQMHEIVA